MATLLLFTVVITQIIVRTAGEIVDLEAIVTNPRNGTPHFWISFIVSITMSCYDDGYYYEVHNSVIHGFSILLGSKNLSWIPNWSL